MKYTLLLDSSNTLLAVGLADENKVLASTIYECWQAQSEHMIPEINSLLEKFNVSLNDLESCMVSIGPGSYTGVRIAITIAKTIAAISEVKIYPVSALQILKDSNKPSICLINARSNRSYIGVYENEKPIVNDTIFTNEQVKEYIANHPSYSICGATKYLGIDAINSNVIEQMFSLKGYLKPIENPLGLKPVYLKD